MQTLNALLNNTASSTVQTNQTKPSDTQESSNNSFLSMVINSVNKNENISEESSKNVVEQNAKKSKIDKKDEKIDSKSNSDEIKTEENLSEESLDKSGTSILEDADFMQILSLLEALNDGKKLDKFPDLSNTLAKFLSTEKNINEIKGAKSLQDIINLSNKFGLGLSNLKITKEDLATLKTEFKALEAKGFFKTQDTQIVLNEVTKQKIEKSLKIDKKSDESTPSLTKLLQSTQTVDDTSSKKTKNKTETNNIKATTNAEDTINLKNTDKSKISAEQTEQKDSKKVDLNGEKNAIQNAKNIETELTKNDKHTKDASSQTTNHTSQKNTKDTNVDDYLANIMQRAIKESSETKDKQIQTTISESFTKEKKTSGENDNMQNNSDQNDSQTSSNQSVKDLVANSKLQLKNAQVKQTFESFASNLQEKIAEYKPPVTRFHMTLNPTNLGEVEVTLINRGNNLHINFNSNNQTMQLFIQNQAEFKNSLVNMGFTELSMNFSDQNKNKEQGQNSKFKNYDDDFENVLNQNEDEQVILEVVVPRYF
ncbi:flagellar hook-length control protein FliK [Campylobacter fetus]|uniref:flagellar hook-length control protein FliK n=2 Tax=Campylobacter fetus TaxID=196 RepID=UPI00138DF066|nr:flagellar hook-length control protein FliK [Campylobacter fetus]